MRDITIVYVNSEANSWRFFIGHIRFMVQKGLAVHVLSSPGRELDLMATQEGATATAVPISRKIAPLADAVSVARLAWFLVRLKPDIVVAHTSKVGIVAMPAAWLARVRVRVYHNHGMAALSAGGVVKFLLRLSEKVSSNLATTVLYVAPSVRAAAIREGFVTPAKARSILSINGLDTGTRFSPDAVSPDRRESLRKDLGIPLGSQVLGFVGRVFKVKGIVELSEAWRELRIRYPDLHWVIVGGLDDREAIPNAVRKMLSTDDRVHLTGHVDDVPAYFSIMDVMAAPSRHEGLGYVVIEALAMGVPVVATAIPGLEDALDDGETGTLVTPGDVVGLMVAIGRYLDSPDLRALHGEEGRRRTVRRFDRHRVWEAHYELYCDLIVARDRSTASVQG